MLQEINRLSANHSRVRFECDHTMINKIRLCNNGGHIQPCLPCWFAPFYIPQYVETNTAFSSESLFEWLHLSSETKFFLWLSHTQRLSSSKFWIFMHQQKFLSATFNGITHSFNAYVMQISMLICCADTSKSHRLLSSSTDTVSCISSTHWVLSWFISQMWLVNIFEHLTSGEWLYLGYIHCLLAGTAQVPTLHSTDFLQLTESAPALVLLLVPGTCFVLQVCSMFYCPGHPSL